MERKDYVLFDLSRDGFDDGAGNNVTLGQHLDYLIESGGTPDFQDSIEDATYTEAKVFALKNSKNDNTDYALVDTTDWRVRYIARAVELTNNKESTPSP